LHPSIGSELHASGNCNKCCFFPRGKCARGYSCTFCHYDHEKLRRRSGKTTAAKGGAAATVPATGAAASRAAAAAAKSESAAPSSSVPLQLAQHVLLPSGPVQQPALPQAGFLPPPAQPRPTQDMVMDILCRPVAHHGPCCNHGHALQPCALSEYICDICRTTGTAYRCSQGCDFDMCEMCHFRTTAHAAGRTECLMMPGQGMPPQTIQSSAWPGAPASQQLASMALPPCLPPSLHVASSLVPPPPPQAPPWFP
jgi:hypothetical protein